MIVHKKRSQRTYLVQKNKKIKMPNKTDNLRKLVKLKVFLEDCLAHFILKYYSDDYSVFWPNFSPTHHANMDQVKLVVREELLC